MQRQEYNSRFAVSQSAIKEFRFKSPKRWREIWIEKQLDLDKNEDAFTFGSLVDTILFTPQLIDERFYISDSTEVPTGAIEKIVKYVYENSEIAPTKVTVDDDMLPESFEKEEYYLEEHRSAILEACNKQEWNGHWKDDTRINKIIEKGGEYFGMLAKAAGRKVISSEMNFEAISVVSTLRKDENVSKYFVDTDTSFNIFQLELFSKYISSDHCEIPLKCAIDILHVDRENGLITVCDFKTSHSAHNFIQSIKQFGYCDQVSFYTYLVQKELEKDAFREQLGLDPSKVWAVTAPINVVIDEAEKSPYIYEYNWKDIHLSQKGNSEYLYELYQTHEHASRIKKGWEEILEEICWHIQNDKWSYPVEFYKKGRISVNLTNG